MLEPARRWVGWRGILVAAIVVLVAIGRAQIREAPVPALVLTLAAVSGDVDPRPPAGAGEAIARLEIGTPGGRLQMLVRGFASAEPPSVSYDGQRAVFVGRRAADEPKQVWEIALGGSVPRRVAGGGECFDPTYLPDERIVYARVVPGDGPVPPLALQVVEANDEEERITFGDARDRAPAVLPDGRIVFRRHPRTGAGSGRLFVVNTDGTGVQLFCPPADGWSVEGGPWVVGERVVFAESRRETSGQRLVAVAAHQPLGGREILVFGDGTENPAWFSSVSAHPEGGLVTAAHTKSEGWAVYRVWSTEPPAARLVGAVPLPGLGDSLRPTGLAVAAPRVRPLRLTSVVDARRSTGTLLCLDVRTSRVAALAGAAAGAVRTVRVLAADGAPLGEAPVEADGSFFAEVPADQPLRLELRGPEGALAADHSGIWVRPNENRGCIGCHEDPELAPENRTVLALDRAATPLETVHAVP